MKMLTEIINWQIYKLVTVSFSKSLVLWGFHDLTAISLNSKFCAFAICLIRNTHRKVWQWQCRYVSSITTLNSIYLSVVVPCLLLGQFYAVSQFPFVDDNDDNSRYNNGNNNEINMKSNFYHSLYRWRLAFSNSTYIADFFFCVYLTMGQSRSLKNSNFWSFLF